MPTTAEGAGAAKRASRAELAKPESALHFLGLTAASERLQQLKKGHAPALPSWSTKSSVIWPPGWAGHRTSLSDEPF